MAIFYVLGLITVILRYQPQLDLDEMLVSWIGRVKPAHMVLLVDRMVHPAVSVLRKTERLMRLAFPSRAADIRRLWLRKDRVSIEKSIHRKVALEMIISLNARCLNPGSSAKIASSRGICE